MITRHFTYHCPDSIEEAVGLLAQCDAEADVVAGGTWVVAEMTAGLRRPVRVVDLARAGLGEIEVEGDELVVGAMATYRDVIDSPVVAERLPVLRDVALGVTGGAQIANRGTIGGSACYANPNSDVPVALAALDARMCLRSVRGVRELPAGEFFLGAYSTALAPGEVLEATRTTIGPGLRAGYSKFKLCAGSWPIVTAAGVERGGRRHIVLGGVQGQPLRVGLPAADGGDLTSLICDAITAPYDDALASGAYKRSIAPAVARRALAALSGAEAPPA